MRQSFEGYRVPEASTPAPKNYYDVLGVLDSATAQEIKKAYHRLARELHPDLRPELSEEEKERLRLLNEANACLSNTERRTAYDTALITQRLNRYDDQVHELLDEFYKLGGRDLLKRPARYQQLPGDEEKLFNNFFPSAKAKSEATRIMSEVGFNRSANIRERFPFVFMDTGPEMDDEMFLKFDSKAIAKDAEDIRSASYRLKERMQDQNFFQNLGLEKKVSEFLEQAKNKLYTADACDYARAIEKVYATSESRSKALPLLQKGRALLEEVQSQKTLNKNHEQQKEIICDLIRTIIS